MNLDKDISSWAKVQPDSVMSMSGAAQKNILTMALHDIAILGLELERLTAAHPLPQARDEWQNEMIEAAMAWGAAETPVQERETEVRLATLTRKRRDALKSSTSPNAESAEKTE